MLPAQSDKDGWVATDDIGEITKEGTLVLVDRKGNLLTGTKGELCKNVLLWVALSGCNRG